VKRRVLRLILILVSSVAALAVSIAVSTQSSPPSSPIDQLIVFGDSLSDTGIVFQATGGAYPPSPPYFQGRYSNGRVWVEYLADRLQLSSSTQLINFAYGGATATASSGSVPSLLSQVESFITAQPQINAQALYVIWAGANDYLQGAQSDAPAEAVTQAIAKLSAAGATRILVANLPNLGQLPATRNNAQAAQLNDFTRSYNQYLMRSIDQLNQSLVPPQSEFSGAIVPLDVNALYQAATLRPGDFQFTEVVQPCLSGTKRCDNAEQFLFWDAIHPTTAAHKILADSAFSALEAADLIRLAEDEA
jgi:thermolabile hemolysin